MSWNDLSMVDKAAIIKIGVNNGITDLNTIRNTYNEFAKGGPIKNSKDYKKVLSDYWHEDVDTHDYDYDKYYNDDPVEAQKQLNLILAGKGGHFPDAGKSGTYKKPTHPTYPDLGDESWSNDDTVFHLSDRQMDGDTDRVLDYLGADLDYNNGSTKAVYKGGFILPTITVTPKGNYTDLIPNELNSGWVYKNSTYNKFSESEKTNTNSNFWTDLGTSLIPIYGTYKEFENFVNEPSWENVGWAALSLVSEIPILKGVKALKGIKLAKTAKTLKEAPIITRSISKGLKKDINKDLLYHLDYGDKAGAFSSHGAHIKGNKLVPGKAKDSSQLDYTWFNEGRPYATGVNGKPLDRAIIVNKKDVPDLIRVRDSEVPIGQWTGKSGFVKKSEMVTPSEVPLDNAYIYNRKKFPIIGEFWLRDLIK